MCRTGRETCGTAGLEAEHFYAPRTLKKVKEISALSKLRVLKANRRTEFAVHTLQPSIQPGGK